MLYTIVHTVINNKGEHPEANARVLGIYSNEDIAINEAEKWIKNTKTSDVNVKRITDTEWYFWYEENGNTYGGCVDVYKEIIIYYIYRAIQKELNSGNVNYMNLIVTPSKSYGDLFKEDKR